MIPPVEKQRETYPWEKREAREAKMRRPAQRALSVPGTYDAAAAARCVADARIYDAHGVGVTESNHPAWQALAAFRGLIDEQAAIDLAGRSAGARSGLYSTPSTLLKDGVTHEYGMLEDGSLADLPETDGHAFDLLWQGETETQTYSDAEAQGLWMRDSEFLFYCKNRCGEVAEADAKAKADAARVKMDAQQMDLALGLASQGIQAFLPAHAPRMSLVDPFSEQVIEIPPVRRVNFFPPVAKARRASMLTHLNAWVEKHPNTRMLTFTSGQRVRLDHPGEVRTRCRFLSRRLSNLHAHPYVRRIGLRMSFRALEAGTLYRACPFPRELGTEDGVVYAHIHAHVFAEFEHQLSPRAFKKFLRRMKSLWRYHWDYGTKVGDPAEACKYPVKPGDLEILTDPEKAAWYHEVFKLHIVQPLGGLRETISARQVAGLKGRKWRTRCKETGVSKTELRFRPDWNARPRLTPEERNSRAYQRERLRKLGLKFHSDAAEMLSYANGLLSFEKRVRRDESRALALAVEKAAQRVATARRAVESFHAGRLSRIGPPLPSRLHKRAAARLEKAYASALIDQATSEARRLAGPRFRMSPEDSAAILAQVSALRAAAITLLRCARPHDERRWVGIRRLKEVERANRPQTIIRNQVVARIGPAPIFPGDRVFRPTLAVWNFDRSPEGFKALRGLPFVCKYGEALASRIASAEAQVSAEGATAVASPSVHSVHTSHITATRANPAQTSFLTRAEVWTHPPDPRLTPADIALDRN